MGASQDIAISDYGEKAIIEAVSQCPSCETTILGPGDDAAVVSANDEKAVVCTDILVEGNHFNLDWVEPFHVGRRAIAQNAADIVAMGARPTGFVVAVAAPADCPVNTLKEIARGTVEEAAKVGADIVGGDYSQAPQLVICVTATGEFSPGEKNVLRQDGAQPGDIIAVSGNLGWSRAGYEICSGKFGSMDNFMSNDLVQRASALYGCPEPPYEDGPVALEAGATSLTDVSDGLMLNLFHIISKSAARQDKSCPDSVRRYEGPPEAGMVQAQLDKKGILAAASDELFGLAELCAQHTDSETAEELLLRWIYHGGEDHALLGTFPCSTKPPANFKVIGKIVASAPESPGYIMVDRELVEDYGGWESFSDEPLAK
ncbi:MAG: thiamine-phosphate kinase [Lawsonella sp.]|nr:thiamine-phosphate kinase [Mycobacteriales bacterium]